MADVRSLLRQQRAARRIEHPHAAYSDAGKLLCTLCREAVKADSLWEGHVRGETHQKKLKARAQSQSQSKQQQSAESIPRVHLQVQDEGTDGSDRSSSLKRKLDDDDEEMGDAEGNEGAGSSYTEEHSRRKRSRPDISTPPSVATPSSNDGAGSEREKDRDSVRSQSLTNASHNRTLTPPTLQRRASNTPSQGVEIQIPSRPATPARREGSSSSTPILGPSTGSTTSLPSRNASTALAAAVASSGDASPAPATMAQKASAISTTGTAPTASAQPTQSGEVDQDEWAAFEADIAAASYDDQATISAPAMTAEQSAAAAAAGGNLDPDSSALTEQERKAKADADRADEREEATRALEDEFEEMEELEARVRRLKEKREAIRRSSRAESKGAQEAVKAALGTEKVVVVEEAVVEDEEEGEEGDDDDDDDDDDEEEDDWDGFRFRAAA